MPRSNLRGRVWLVLELVYTLAHLGLAQDMLGLRLAVLAADARIADTIVAVGVRRRERVLTGLAEPLFAVAAVAAVAATTALVVIWLRLVLQQRLVEVLVALTELHKGILVYNLCWKTTVEHKRREEFAALFKGVKIQPVGPLSVALFLNLWGHRRAREANTQTVNLELGIHLLKRLEHLGNLRHGAVKMGVLGQILACCWVQRRKPILVVDGLDLVVKGLAVEFRRRGEIEASHLVCCYYQKFWGSPCFQFFLGGLVVSLLVFNCRPRQVASGIVAQETDDAVVNKSPDISLEEV